MAVGHGEPVVAAGAGQQHVHALIRGLPVKPRVGSDPVNAAWRRERRRDVERQVDVVAPAGPFRGGADDMRHGQRVGHQRLHPLFVGQRMSRPTRDRDERRITARAPVPGRRARPR